MSMPYGEDRTDEYGEPLPEDDGYRPPEAIDWDTFLDEEVEPPLWLPGRLMTEGQQIALVGDGKVGKSLLAQEWAWRAVAGLAFLGDEPRDPIRVMYADRENSRDDIRERMKAFGATKDELRDRLKYLPFPQFGPLDTPAGAAVFLAAVDHFAPDLIILDTISRMIAGKENDSDTWLAFYRYTVAPIKAAGLSSVRLDHFGKDKERGARGNSAKTQDVDHVWELTEADALYRLKRTHTRTGKGAGEVAVRRHGRKEIDAKGREYWAHGATWHELVEDGDARPSMPPARLKLLEALRAAGDWTTGNRLVDWIKEKHGHPLSRQTWSRELNALAAAKLVDRMDEMGRQSKWKLIDEVDQ